MSDKSTLQELEEGRKRFEHKARFFKTEVSQCGICGGKKISDLGHGKREGTIVCYNRECQSKHWKCWHTREEWAVGIESDKTWEKMMRAKGFELYN